jgi:alpha-ketoglutarate-dependent taurine dioxygenase
MTTSLQDDTSTGPAGSGLTESALDVRPLTPRIGAEIRGLDLGTGVDGETFAAIRQAALRHRVIFFRGQNLSSDEHIAFARRFGELTRAHPTIPAVDGVPTLYDLDSEGGAHADMWHSDVTFVDQPPDFSVLRAVTLPDIGGDTLWASTVAAYEALSVELQQLAIALRALHSNDYDYVRVDLATLERKVDSIRLAHMRQFASTVYRTEHPVARVHPETGEHALLLGSFAQRLLGYTTSESVDLIRLFQNYVTKPDHTVRWQWQPGDVAVWDNRSTQHYATYDYGSDHRRVQRVTTVGSVPVGIDGRLSRSLQGDASLYNEGVA